MSSSSALVKMKPATRERPPPSSPRARWNTIMREMTSSSRTSCARASPTDSSRNSESDDDDDDDGGGGETARAAPNNRFRGAAMKNAWRGNGDLRFAGTDVASTSSRPDLAEWFRTVHREAMTAAPPPPPPWQIPTILERLDVGGGAEAGGIDVALPPSYKNSPRRESTREKSPARRDETRKKRRESARWRKKPKRLRTRRKSGAWATTRGVMKAEGRCGPRVTLVKRKSIDVYYRDKKILEKQKIQMSMRYAYRVRKERIDKYSDNFYLSLFATICCCFPIGLVSLFFSFKVREYLAKEDRDRARLSSLLGRKLATAAVMCGMLGGSVMFVYYFVKITEPYASSDYDYYLPEYGS